jgi:hypothetical protein
MRDEYKGRGRGQGIVGGEERKEKMKRERKMKGE